MEVTPQILNALKKGDHKAIEMVINLYSEKLKIYICGYVRSEADAKELADNIFVILWENRSVINLDMSFNSYLYTIARNSALNFLKRKLVNDNYIEQLILPREDYSTEDEIIACETASQIKMLVEKMPAQRKKIFCLSRKDGLSNEQIAKKLKTTKRNVESQLSHALRIIKEHIFHHIDEATGNRRKNREKD